MNTSLISSDAALRDRVAKLLAMLGSPEEHEAVVALRMLSNVLQANNLTFAHLADALVSGAVQAETEPDVDPMGWTVPRTVDDWFELIGDLVDAKAWASDREKHFLMNVWDWTNGGGRPSQAQCKWILDIRERYRDHGARGP